MKFNNEYNEVAQRFHYNNDLNEDEEDEEVAQIFDDNNDYNEDFEEVEQRFQDNEEGEEGESPKYLRKIRNIIRKPVQLASKKSGLKTLNEYINLLKEEEEKKSISGKLDIDICKLAEIVNNNNYLE